MITINYKNDHFYEISRDVIDLISDELKSSNLGVDVLEKPEGYHVKRLRTMVYCASEESDRWYLPTATPRTVLYAVLLDVLREKIEFSPTKWKDTMFWSEISGSFDANVLKIDEIVENMSNGDKINLDKYREIFKGD